MAATHTRQPSLVDMAGDALPQPYRPPRGEPSWLSWLHRSHDDQRRLPHRRHLPPALASRRVPPTPAPTVTAGRGGVRRGTLSTPAAATRPSAAHAASAPRPSPSPPTRPRLGPSSTSTRPPSSPLESTRRSTRPCLIAREALRGALRARRIEDGLSALMKGGGPCPEKVPAAAPSPLPPPTPPSPPPDRLPPSARPPSRLPPPFSSPSRRPASPSPACRQPTSPSPPRSLPLPSQYEVGVPSARTCSKAYNRTAAACRRRPPSATRTSRTRVRCAAALPPRGCLPFKHLNDAPAPRRHRAFARSLSRLGPSSTSTRPPSSPLQSTRRSTRPCLTA